MQLADRPPLHWWAVVPADRSGRAVRRDLAQAAHLTATPLDRFVEDGKPQTDLASLVHLVVGAAPGGVLLWLPPAPAGTLAAALRTAGYAGWLVGPSPLDSPVFVAAAGPAATGVRVAEFQADAGLRGRAEEFQRRYRQKFATAPDFSAAAAYDAARVLIETLRHARDGAGYRQFPLALPTTGANGVLHFDNSGNRTDPLQVLTCQQGCFIPISPNDTKP